MNLSVVVCTRNPRPDYLRRVFEALRAQTLVKHQWELLLVDNASKDLQADHWDLSWHPSARHIREDKIGKTYALLTAIQQARGDILMTVDDDNVLASDYLEAAWRLGGEYPHLGVWGGSCIAEFEMPAPTFLHKYLNRLAITTVSRPRWSNSYEDFEAIPPGAGMVFRRNVAERYCRQLTSPEYRRIFCSDGKAQIRGFGLDDTNIAWTAIDMGFSTGRFPELKLTHIIPRQRLDPAYMLALIEGDATSRVLLDQVRQQKSFPDTANTSFVRALWLRLRLPTFDYQAWQATQSGIRKGKALLKQS
jgi:glycosyltransferase involved in cell wall biosynthesis